MKSKFSKFLIFEMAKLYENFFSVIFYIPLEFLVSAVYNIKLCFDALLCVICHTNKYKLNSNYLNVRNLSLNPG